MIKIVKECHDNIKPAKKFEVTCNKCHSIFQCDENDCRRAPVCQGFWAWAILCPVCHNECVDWQGGCDRWAHL